MKNFLFQCSRFRWFILRKLHSSCMETREPTTQYNRGSGKQCFGGASQRNRIRDLPHRLQSPPTREGETIRRYALHNCKCGEYTTVCNPQTALPTVTSGEIIIDRFICYPYRPHQEWYRISGHFRAAISLVSNIF